LPDPTGQITVSKLTKLVPGDTSKTDRPRILTQVSFELSPGDGLGVIGNSASGKSTLARLLVGAWNPDGGEIRLDGATPDQWEPAVLGRSIGYLPQQVEMLPGSIRDNIARFDGAASDEAVIAAARLAGVHDMILRLPSGYATRLGGPEQPLSGGQIQRLGLARALFGKPKLIILDEPNSNLDVSGDNALAEAIGAMRASGATVIVMAHRPSAIAAVNKVLILHGGMVAAFGDKTEVLSAAIQGADPAVTGGRTVQMTAGPGGALSEAAVPVSVSVKPAGA
jgi:ABC-type protease/lipase transport system fused ATPase/permease subunit